MSCCTVISPQQRQKLLGICGQPRELKTTSTLEGEWSTLGDSALVPVSSEGESPRLPRGASSHWNAGPGTTSRPFPEEGLAIGTESGVVELWLARNAGKVSIVVGFESPPLLTYSF